jgi:hypothetical protein
MRTSTLLALAAFLPATSQATLLINGSWDTMASNDNALAGNVYPDAATTYGHVASFVLNDTNSYGGFWQLSSITIDGITPYNPNDFTPTASDFSLSIFSTFTNSVVSTVTASSVGSYVSNGDGTSRFSLTFTNIPSPEFNGTGMFGFIGGPNSYGLDLNVIGFTGFPVPSANYVTYRGFYLQGDPIMNGEATGITWVGPAPIVVNGTNSWGTPPAVPEPSTYGLIGLGALGLAFVARRRKAKTA